MAGFLWFGAMALLFVDGINKSPFFFTLQLTLGNLAQAFINVVTEALVCEYLNELAP